MENKCNYTGYNPKLKEKARKSRKNMTWYERKLWFLYLKDFQLKFYRQRIISTYIADFYCPKAKLIVELDGTHHTDFDESQKDDIRTEILKTYGIRILRFTNYEIKNRFDDVCETIRKSISQSSAK